LPLFARFIFTSLSMQAIRSGSSSPKVLALPRLSKMYCFSKSGIWRVSALSFAINPSLRFLAAKFSSSVSPDASIGFSAGFSLSKLNLACNNPASLQRPASLKYAILSRIFFAKYSL